MKNKVTPDNLKIYNETWKDWSDMKAHGPASKFLRYLIKEQLKLISDKSTIANILDVGCGEGTNTALIAKLFRSSHVIGIDFSLAGIELAMQRYKLNNLSFVHDMSSTALNLQYDLITCFEVIEHVEDWKAFVKKMAASSSKYILISTPTGRMRDFEVNVGHLRNFKKHEVENEMKNLGFRTVKALYAGFPFYSPIYRNLCNKMNVGGNSFEKGTYSFKQKIVSNCLYFAFRFLSSKDKFGDKFCALFEKNI